MVNEGRIWLLYGRIVYTHTSKLCIYYTVHSRKLSLFFRAGWMVGFVCFIRIPGLCVMRYTSNGRERIKKKRVLCTAHSIAHIACHQTLRGGFWLILFFARKSPWLLRIYDRVNRFVTDGAWLLAVSCCRPKKLQGHSRLSTAHGTFFPDGPMAYIQTAYIRRSAHTHTHTYGLGNVERSFSRETHHPKKSINTTSQNYSHGFHQTFWSWFIYIFLPV